MNNNLSILNNNSTISNNHFKLVPFTTHPIPGIISSTLN